MIEPHIEGAPETPAQRKKRLLSEKVLHAVASRLGNATNLSVLADAVVDLASRRTGACQPLCIPLACVLVRSPCERCVSVCLFDVLLAGRHLS